MGKKIFQFAVSKIIRKPIASKRLLIFKWTKGVPIEGGIIILQQAWFADALLNLWNIALIFFPYIFSLNTDWTTGTVKAAHAKIGALW